MTVDVAYHHCGASIEEGGRLYPKAGVVYLVPCSDCLDAADKRGFDRGLDQGKSEGYDEGLTAGEAAVRDDVKSMLQIVKEESCAELKAGAIHAPVS